MLLSNLILLGNYVSPESFNDSPKVGTALFVIKDGIIVEMLNPKEDRAKKLIEESKIEVLTEDEILIPGFVDTHFHAPQFPFSGITPPDQLMNWLEKYAFPTEGQFRDEKYAESVYTQLVTTLLSNGTTTASYFATTDVHASVILAKTCLQKGQRAFVGLVSMDRNAPEDYADGNTVKALEEAETFIKEVKSLKQSQLSLVQPVLTPRFIPTCSNNLLKGLGKLAKQYDC